MAANMKSRKSPWVPPPGRSYRQEKVVGKSQAVSSPTITPHDKTSKHEENIDDDVSEISHVSLIASSDGTPCELNVNLSSIKHEMKLFSTHFASLKQMSLFLNGFFRTSGIHDQATVKLLSKVDDRIKEFIYEFDELEYSVTFVENILHEGDKTDEYFKTIKLKEHLLSKLLECYSNTVLIFQTVIQKQISEDIAKFQKDHDLLRKQLQSSEKKCGSQEAVITDLERRLSIFQGKTNTLESYNSTLEATKAELLKQLSYKEAQIKYLNSELSLSAINKGSNDSEKLLEVIEEMKKISCAEKIALKKALKLEKLHVKQREESIQKLQKDVKKKDDMIFDVASQRDKLKSHLTSANNNIIEGKNHIEEIKSQNLKLQNELCEKESILKKQIQDISDALKAKTEELNYVGEENFKLKKWTETMKEDLEKNIEELRTAKSKLLDPNVYLSRNHGNGNQETALDEIRHLISLLADSKEYFKTIKTVLHSAEDNMQTEKNYNSISMTIGEMKDYLVEIKEFCDTFPKENNVTSELEKQLQELKCLYSDTSKENDRLKSEIEEIKNSRAQHPQIMSPGNSYPTAPGIDHQFMARNTQMELSLKTEENWRLKQREKDLERQLDEVKEKLQKREIENGKMFRLEEELMTKRTELSVLNKRFSEESERSAHRIKELTEALDKRSTEYDSLEQYVKTLKSSYTNVFGNS